MTETDLPTFIKFLSTEEAWNYLRMILIKRSSIHESSNGKISNLKIRMPTEIEANNKDTVLSSICDFISNSSGIQCILFENVILLEKN